MRILMLDNEFPPLGGGMGTANLELMRELARNEAIQLDLVTAALGGRAEFEQFAERIRIYKVPVWNQNIHHSTNRELAFYAAQALWQALRLNRVRRYDFCFAWSALPAGAVALALRRLQGLPYFVWVSGPDIPGFEQRYARLYPLLTPLLRQVWVGSERVIAKCQEEVAMIRAVDTSFPIEIIENGVNLEHFSPARPPSLEGPLRVICAARLIERKGQRHLIQAVHRLVQEGLEVQLQLVGDGDERAAYTRLAGSLGLNGQVQFAGYVPRERLPEYFRAAHVFALPSYNEGMALAALEAMGCGLPVVLTRTGGTDMLVQEGVNGYTHAWGDVDALAGSLRKFAQDRSLIYSMGAASRQRSLRYGWKALAEEYLQLFANFKGKQIEKRSIVSSS